MTKGRLEALALVLITSATACTIQTPGDCRPDHFASGSAMPDGQAATSDDIEVWALFLPAQPSDVDGQPIVVHMVDVSGAGDVGARRGTKIVWRATGEGTFAVTAIGPGGSVVEPYFIDDHGGSNWARPGGEWGTGWEFPESGCWTFVVERGDDTAEISIEVRV